MSADREQVMRLVRSRVEQGLPEKVADPGALRLVAAILAAHLREQDSKRGSP